MKRQRENEKKRDEEEVVEGSGSILGLSQGFRRVQVDHQLVAPVDALAPMMGEDFKGRPAGFLAVPYPKPLTFTVEEPHRMAERVKGECYANRAHKIHELLAWMTATYQINYLGSLPKEDVYMDYLHLCEVSDKEPLSKAMLGKILHQAFQNITCNRLGPRGQTKHCYKGLQRKPVPTPMTPQEMARQQAPVALAADQLRSAVVPAFIEARIAAPVLSSPPAERKLPLKKRVKVERRDDDTAQGKEAHTNGRESEDEESDYEQQEVPEHSSEGNQTSDWEGDASDCLGYLELMKEPSVQRRPSYPNGVSDSLLQFLRASPNHTGGGTHGGFPLVDYPVGHPSGGACCGCGESDCSAAPQLNPPPYISLFSTYPQHGAPTPPFFHPGQYAMQQAMHPVYQHHPQLPPIYAPQHFTTAPPSGSSRPRATSKATLVRRVAD